MWKNSDSDYGNISKCLHWLAALTVFSLFGLGLWMVELDYYDSWYRKGPNLHRSIGVLLMLLMLGRLIWLMFSNKPQPLASHRPWERALATIVQWLMIILIFTIGITGYLITTADGLAVDVFNWFSIPSSGKWISNQEDLAGDLHKYLAYSMVSLALLHAIAAFKHHFIDKDTTLKRMGFYHSINTKRS